MPTAFVVPVSSAEEAPDIGMIARKHQWGLDNLPSEVSDAIAVHLRQLQSRGRSDGRTEITDDKGLTELCVGMMVER
jgi:hypothetical protein